jgi:hypothetical protein
MTITTYPNGQTLQSSALTVSQINILLQALTCGMISINPPDPSQVRIDWPTEGQPVADSPSEDVCYLRAVIIDDSYDKLRDLARTNQEPSPTPVQYTWNYTRVWSISWILYGPASLARSTALRSALFMDYFTDQLSLSNLFPNPDNQAPTRVPELANAQWWERSDFSCEMNEFVTETISVPAVQSVPVTVQSEEMTVNTTIQN